MAISRMQNPQQLQGIGSLRQPYGLGKLVKKAFRGLKKVVKSPIGKAAILGGLGMWGMGAGPFAKLGGSGWLRGAASKFGALKSSAPAQGLGGWAKKWLNPFNKANPLLWSGAADDRKFSGWKAAGLGAAGLVAAPFIQKKLGWGPYQEGDEEEESDWSVTPSSILNIKNMARARDPSLDFLPSSAYTQSGFYGADGGRAGLLNGGEAGEAQMEQMLRAEYIKYKNQGGTMPYEQFKILVMQQAQQGQMPNQMMEAGGRAGYLDGEMVEQQTDLIEGPQGTNEFQETVVEGQEQPSQEQLEALAMEIFQLPLEELDEEQLLVVYQEAMQGQPMEEAVQEEDVQFAARGGRMGYENGELVTDESMMAATPTGMMEENVEEIQGEPTREELEALAMEIFQLPLEELDEQQLMIVYKAAMQEQPAEEAVQEEDVQFAAQGGRMGYQYGGDDEDDVLHQNKAMAMYRTRRQEGGLMDLGGQEKDYRDNGGFVPLGKEERADDVPARLSKNEFVFTADAVRAAGGGDIDAGSEVMQNVMDNLEQGGEVSEDSQGLQGGEEIMSEEIIDESNPAQGMYDNYEQLQSRVA